MPEDPITATPVPTQNLEAIRAELEKAPTGPERSALALSLVAAKRYTPAEVVEALRSMKPAALDMAALEQSARDGLHKGER